MKYKAFADGGCRPKNNKCKNSFGHCGFIILDDNNQEVYKKSLTLGNYSSNNIAEFQSLLHLVKYIHEHLKDEEVVINMDSLLTVKGINGDWNIKDETLLKIKNKILPYINKKITIKWISRDYNIADKLTR